MRVQSICSGGCAASLGEVELGECWSGGDGLLCGALSCFGSEDEGDLWVCLGLWDTCVIRTWLLCLLMRRCVGLAFACWSANQVLGVRYRGKERNHGPRLLDIPSPKELSVECVTPSMLCTVTS
jgi:hypothetical protein